MIINHNMSSVNAEKALKFRSWELDKSIEKLSSGERIVHAGDDASGLAISERMRTQIQGLRRAEKNTEDGISFVQTADGFLGHVSDALQRIRVLAIQSANGIYHEDDRKLMQVEVSQLVDEIDRVASQAEFNSLKMFLGDYARTSKKASMWFHIGANENERERAYLNTMTSIALGVKNVKVMSAGDSNKAIGSIDSALSKMLNQRATLGAYSNRFEVVAKSLMTAYENIQAAESNVRDADMAEEMVEFTRNQLLESAATSMLAQSNLQGQNILRLLGNR